LECTKKGKKKLTPTCLAIVMEYASGGDLFQGCAMLAGKLSEDEVLISYPTC